MSEPTDDCVKCDASPALRVPGGREQTEAGNQEWDRAVRVHLRLPDDGWAGPRIRAERDNSGVLVAWSVLR